MQTLMRREINEVPDATARLLENSASALKDAGTALREKDPAFLVTIARGSSDHAALFLKYAIELTAGRPVASLGPSLASIYGAQLKLDQAAAIAISQSGQSPDIVSMVAAANKAGALTLALTNTPQSPLADASACSLDISAGPEVAVAATKSFVNSIVAGLAILAEWTDDTALRRGVATLPDHFASAIQLDWQDLAQSLSGVQSLYVVGRGPSLAIANEAALKFKETSGVHAEAFSSAEVLHGPVALVGRDFPVIGLAARDAAEQSMVQMVNGLAAKGTFTCITSDGANPARRLPFVATGHPITDSLALIIPFYGFIEAWSRQRGLNPDAPANLKKVTETQ